MNDDVRKYIYTTLTIFVLGLIVWIGFLFVNACGFTLTCNRGCTFCGAYANPNPSACYIACHGNGEWRSWLFLTNAMLPLLI